MPISVVLFDLDNTLYSRHNGVHAELEQHMDTYVARSLKLDTTAAHTIRKRLYERYGTTLRGMMEEYHIDAEEYLAFVHNIALERYLRPDAELDQLIGALQAQRVIFTNSPSEHAQRVLTALGLRHHFPQIFDLRFFEFRSKPDPFGYRRALDLLGVEGHTVALVEDSPRNLAPARELGMRTILVCEPPLTGASAEADLVVTDVYQAIHGLLEWGA